MTDEEAQNESVLDRSPHEVVSQMLKGHNGMDSSGVRCLGCGEKIADPTGSWMDAARALHRHQWAVMGVFSPDAQAFKEGECAPAPGCGCLCHRPGNMAVSHFAPCCDVPAFSPEEASRD
jgi:hypothetical protein